jgi:hypothetical protein
MLDRLSHLVWGFLTMCNLLIFLGADLAQTNSLYLGQFAMPRRRAVTREQLEVLLALPATETDLIRHWTLGAADLAAIERRRGDPNQLGFALQLCAFRYPGRVLRPHEAIPELLTMHSPPTPCVCRRVARSLALCARSSASATFAPEHRRELRTWLLPVALGNTDAVAIAATMP